MNDFEKNNTQFKTAPKIIKKGIYIFITVLSVALFLMSLLLAIAVPIVGIIGIIIAVVLFFFARSQLKSSKKNDKTPKDLLNLTQQMYEQSSYQKEAFKKTSARRLVKDITYSEDYPNSFIVIDLETTGLDPTQDEILQIGAIKYCNGTESERYMSYCKPTRPIPAAVSRVNHIYDNTVSDAPDVRSVLTEFVKFIGDYTLVAHNAPFDIKFVQTFLYANNMELLKNEVVDTLPLSRMFLRLDNYKLETIKEYYNINQQSHEALSDCYACAKVGS